MGWWRVLVETWWWVLCGVALGAVAARQLLRRPPLPIETHPTFLELRTEVAAQRRRGDELAEALVEVERDRRALIDERDESARRVRELQAELHQARRRAASLPSGDRGDANDAG